MSPVELPVITPSTAGSERSTVGRLHDPAWVRTARRARALSWASLVWMTVEGVVGLIAGLDQRPISPFHHDPLWLEDKTFVLTRELRNQSFFLCVHGHDDVLQVISLALYKPDRTR